MTRRGKEPVLPGRPTPPWMAGIMIGVTISSLAAGAMLLGAGLAFGQAIIRNK